MFIDIHAHAYRVKPFPKPWNVDRNFCTAEELIARYDELGIEKGAVLPIVSPEVYSPQTNEEVLEIVEKYPDRLFAFCNVDPRMLTNCADAPLDWVLSYYKDKGCKGLGEVMPNLYGDLSDGTPYMALTRDPDFGAKFLTEFLCY